RPPRRTSRTRRGAEPASANPTSQRSRRTSTWSRPSVGSWNSRTAWKPAFEIEAGDPVADLHDAGVVGVVGDEVRLDEADRTAVEQDEVVVGWVACLDRRHVVRDDVLV